MHSISINLIRSRCKRLHIILIILIISRKHKCILLKSGLPLERQNIGEVNWEQNNTKQIWMLWECHGKFDIIIKLHKGYTHKQFSAIICKYIMRKGEFYINQNGKNVMVVWDILNTYSILGILLRSACTQFYISHSILSV